MPKPQPPASLKGLPILITGASSGIGLATAKACAKAGMPVMLAARREDRLLAAVKDIQSAGGQAASVVCDVASEDACALAVARTREMFGSIYCVFANAGYGFESSVMSMDSHKLRDLFETNFFGTLSIVRPAAEAMVAAKKGHVLICSSGLSKISLPNFAAYCASKAMQDHFGRSMRLELDGTGVFVSTVHPISTETEFSQTVEKMTASARRSVRTPKGMRQSAEHVADCIVECLKHPRGEVWPAPMARWLLAVATAAPSFADWLLLRRQRKIEAGEVQL